MTSHSANKGRGTKRSTLAGTWYPGDQTTLREMVNNLLSQAPPVSVTSLAGLVVPHAGYQYSGAVAATAYRLLRGIVCERIVLLAPCHRTAFRGVAVLDADRFETPLGDVRIDPATAGLIRSDWIHADAAPFDHEHSLEIQLPFLQSVQPNATVIPLLFGELAPADYTAIGCTLADLASETTIFVVSSDFTHYGSRFAYEPFPARDAEQVRTQLRELDMGAIAPVLQGDARAFQHYLTETGATVCGRVPLAAFLSWPGPYGPGELLKYQTSLDVTGDYEHCVSYAAIAFPRRAPVMRTEPCPSTPWMGIGWDSVLSPRYS